MCRWGWDEDRGPFGGRGVGSCGMGWDGRSKCPSSPSLVHRSILLFSFLVVGKEGSVLVGYFDHGVGQGVVCVL